MVTRISSALLSLVLIVVTQLVIAASRLPGSNTASLDHPKEVLANVVAFIIFFLPAVVLAYFNHLACRIISALWHFLTAMILLFVTMALIFTGHIGAIIVAGLTTLILILSGIIILIAQNRP
ncbi:hypothetical protein N9R04_07270 [Staphylococcus sp. SQ8-PEA]|uniref:Uncharacterized protein n=1 Tax=Staphylococcus marylandisciuri TaxID=2981529 RepID=A0ABT2QRB1_9STAP|nr:hypothetical protein [Staphylococcus marylandisciuri]MCU5746515.1 hypothetical protein [Staphylococcus marylandisciuri]